MHSRVPKKGPAKVSLGSAPVHKKSIGRPETPAAPALVPHRLEHSLAHLHGSAPSPAPASRLAIQAKLDEEAYNKALASNNYKAAAKHLKGANDEERRQAIHATDTDLLPRIFENTSHPGTRLDLWERHHERRARARYMADVTPHQQQIHFGRSQDAKASAEHLRALHASEWSFDSTKNQRISDLMRLKRKTSGIEQRHGLSLRSTDPKGDRPNDTRGFRQFSGDELDVIDRTLERLPTAHVRDNPRLTFLRREQRPVNSDDTDTGAAFFDADSGVNVYDSANVGPYRAQGQTSRLGGHPHGQEVTAMEDVLTHEIGHSVHANLANEFATFQHHAGWEAYGSDDAVRAALTHGAAMQDQQANAVIAALDQDRDRPFHQRAPQQHGGYHYVVDPDHAGRYYRRRANRMPGDADTPQSDPHDYMAYAQTSPKEHFAEMYSQMVHTPERVHADYVTAPQERFEQADQAYEQQRATGTFQQLQQLMRTKQERQAQRDALRGQWRTMREQVFGVDANAVTAARQQVHQRFVHHGRGAESQPFLETFDREAEKVATPHQLDQLVTKYRRAADNHHQSRLAFEQ